MIKKVYVIEIRELKETLTEWLTSMNEIRYDAEELLTLVLDRYPLIEPIETIWEVASDKDVFESMYRNAFLYLEEQFHKLQIRGMIRDIKFSHNFVYISVEEDEHILA